MRIRRLLTLLLAATAATAIATAGPAAAAPAPAAAAAAPSFAAGYCPDTVPPVGTQALVFCSGRWTYGSQWVDVWWGFAYSPANNHLRAVGQMVASSTSVRNRADALVLGDRNGVLVSTPGVAQGTLNLQTDPAVDCHRPNGVYLFNLHYSIRWPDNALTSAKQTGQLTESAGVICT